MDRQSFGKTLGSCLVALLVGISQPFLFALSMLFMATPVMICVLFAWAGALPALLASVASLVCIEWLFGAETMWYAFAVMVVPAFLSIGWLKKRVPFFRHLCLAAAVEFAVILGLLGIAYLRLRTDLVDAFMAILRDWFFKLPDSLQNLTLYQFGLVGWFEESVVKALSEGGLEAARRAELIESLTSQFGYALKLTLPGMIASSSILTGVLMTYLPARICARRGDEPPVSFVSVERWFLPTHAVSGLLFCFVLSIVLQYAAVAGADTLTSTVLSVIYLLCTMQGVAALSRRLKATGVSPGKRTALLTLTILFAVIILRVVGGLSALFGRRGLISTYVRRKMKEKNKGDDDQ